ncbi:DNA repair protein RecO [Desulfoferrobacter suflitae]|uniref:DNA repair protein RecO n=1 Tax=Desulfoferrobacter suflitae TaxID=2865782 RepID=UPI002164C42A|nr:DNA repair protein RecO [Desulfoferrobacter suflitae]MCK8600397.1 DNA repair protein RecO [Desulfoferrobacter suflitae]
MIVQTTEAIVLQTQDYKESDRLITFYTRGAGKLKGLAKGARRSRKRFANTFELFSLVNLTYRAPKSLVWIEACKLLEPHLALRSDLQRWAHAALACEVVLEMTPEGDTEEELFLLLKSALPRFAAGKDPENLVLLFLLRFLSITGYLPELGECSVCKKRVRSATRWNWNMGRGTLFCPEHHAQGGGVSLDLGTLMLIRQLRQLPLEKIWRLHLLQDNKSRVFNALVEWMRGQIGRDLNSLKLLEQIRPIQNGV